MAHSYCRKCKTSHDDLMQCPPHSVVTTDKEDVAILRELTEQLGVAIKSGNMIEVHALFSEMEVDIVWFLSVCVKNKGGRNHSSDEIFQ